MRKRYMIIWIKKFFYNDQKSKEIMYKSIDDKEFSTTEEVEATNKAYYESSITKEFFRKKLLDIIDNLYT